MQIVIDIPGYMYKEIVEKEYHSTADSLILDGVILPKGHGRLIDADAYRKEMLDSREFDFFKRLDMQSTIIEADKAESEG